MGNIGRLAGDLYLWSTWEFGMVEVADDMAGTSSMMPQKKNPQAVERVRGLSGSAIGWLPTVLGTLRSGSSSDLDLHFVPDPTEDMARTTYSALELLGATLGGMVIKSEVMKQRANADWATASNLADELVRSTGISFRAAHQVVGTLVRTAAEAGLSSADITGEMLEAAAISAGLEGVSLPAKDLQAALDPLLLLNSLVSEGSANPAEVERMVTVEREVQARHQTWVVAKKRHIRGASRRLRSATERLVQAG
jgi:argininosuccinate lyase